MKIEAPSFISAKDVVQFSGRGTIYSHTTVYQAPTGYEKYAPYPIAIVKLAEGPLVTAQLTDPDPDKPFKIGMPVEMVTRQLKTEGDKGMLFYGYKFRPLLQDSN
ncbi:MAG: Zn-ribbon domain-containing OB-fold protein [Patescibacteria group bacterium]